MAKCAALNPKTKGKDMQTTGLTAPNYAASGAQRGLNTHSHNPDEDLLKRFAIIRDGNPESKPSSGTWIATRDTAEEARIKAEALALSYPGVHWHIYDDVSGSWEPVES